MNLTYFLSYIPFFMCKTMLSVQHKGNHNNSAWLCRWSIAAWQEKITPLPLILACSVALQERALNTKGKKKKEDSAIGSTIFCLCIKSASSLNLFPHVLPISASSVNISLKHTCERT